ncbi:unnamed protein product [Phytophthora fragariaefolia]|uniref:Unnamed protein product n=1 Tax=Phytophthora fragariaefolia TaxID=1490495 RepID=A0A9W6XZT2_9STRA|nr:unnamed protein product [Phytophthora fragariaefolia]
MSPKAQAAETRRTSPGTSLAKVRETTSKRKAPSSSAAPARKRLRGRLRVLDDDSDSEPDSGGLSDSSDTWTLQRRKTAARPDSTPVASKSRSLSLSRSSSKAPSPPPKRSPPRSRRAFAACSRATSRASSCPRFVGGCASVGEPHSTGDYSIVRSSGCVRYGGRVTILPDDIAAECSSHTASQSSRSALSSDESVATIVLSDGEAEVEDQPKSAEVTSSVPSTCPAVSSGSASTVCGVADGQNLVSFPLHTHNTYARRA